MTDAEFRAETVFFPVLRRQYDPGFDRVHRTGDLHFFSVQPDLPAGLRGNSEDRSRCLGTSRSHQSRESDDLALIEGEIDVADEMSGI